MSDARRHPRVGSRSSRSLARELRTTQPVVDGDADGSTLAHAALFADCARRTADARLVSVRRRAEAGALPPHRARGVHRRSVGPHHDRLARLASFLGRAHAISADAERTRVFARLSLRGQRLTASVAATEPEHAHSFVSAGRPGPCDPEAAISFLGRDALRAFRAERRGVTRAPELRASRAAKAARAPTALPTLGGGRAAHVAGARAAATGHACAERRIGRALVVRLAERTVDAFGCLADPIATDELGRAPRVPSASARIAFVAVRLAYPCARVAAQPGSTRRFIGTARFTVACEAADTFVAHAALARLVPANGVRVARVANRSRSLASARRVADEPELTSRARRARRPELDARSTGWARRRCAEVIVGAAFVEPARISRGPRSANRVEAAVRYERLCVTRGIERCETLRCSVDVDRAGREGRRHVFDPAGVTKRSRRQDRHRLAANGPLTLRVGELFQIRANLLWRRGAIRDVGRVRELTIGERAVSLDTSVRVHPTRPRARRGEEQSAGRDCSEESAHVASLSATES